MSRAPTGSSSRATAATRPDLAIVKTFADVPLGLFGVVAAGRTLYAVTTDFASYATLETPMRLLLPPALTVAFLGYVYLLSRYISASTGASTLPGDMERARKAATATRGETGARQTGGRPPERAVPTLAATTGERPGTATAGGRRFEPGTAHDRSSANARSSFRVAVARRHQRARSARRFAALVSALVIHGDGRVCHLSARVRGVRSRAASDAVQNITCGRLA